MLLEDWNQTSILTQSVPEISHHYSQIWNEFRENQFYRLTSSDGILKAISGQSNYNLPWQAVNYISKQICETKAMILHMPDARWQSY